MGSFSWRSKVVREALRNWKMRDIVSSSRVMVCQISGGIACAEIEVHSHSVAQIPHLPDPYVGVVPVGSRLAAVRQIT
jgi:hypothetical protein